MGIFSGCLFACDIDGTLMASGYINPRNIEKIEFFMSEGGCFSLSTGRTAGAVGPVLDKIKRVSPSVVANGCMIYDYENEKVLYEKVLPREDYRIAKKVLDTGLPVGIEAHCGSQALIIRDSNEGHDHLEYEWLNGTYLSFDEAAKYNWNKVVYLFDNEENIPIVKSIIAEEKTSSCFSDTSAMISGRTRHYYEQFPAGVSKAFALDKLKEMLKIDKGGLFAMGDYYNDLEMIKMADISAVPLGTPEDVCSYADYRAVSCEDGAVADFIDYLTEIRKGMI